MKRMTIYKYKTVYKIYQIENGLLVEPTNVYGSPRYNESETIEEALEKLENGTGSDYVILPVATVDYTFE